MSSLVRDTGVIAWRNLLNVARAPALLLAGVVQPLMFVLLLAYVFGGSLGGGAYREFLMGGIFAQTIAFNAAFTTVGLANDLQRGFIDRLRTLPMSRLAVILGRTTSDVTTSCLSLAVTTACGLLIGWRVHTGLWQIVAAYLLILLFAFAMSWIGAWIGLAAPSVEVAQSAGLIWLFPVTFISSGFVSVSAMPAGLRTIAEWNPITSVANAVRELFGNPTPATLPQPHGWPAEHSVLYAVLCSVAIIAVFVPLAGARYRRSTAR